METAHTHFREQYEVGALLPDDDPDKMLGNPMYEATPWLKEESFPFREFVSSYHSAVLSAGIEFLRLTVIGLGLDEHVLMTSSCQSLYPVCNLCTTQQLLGLKARVQHLHVLNIMIRHL